MTDETKGDGMTLERVREDIVAFYTWEKDPSIVGMCKMWIAAIDAHLVAQSAMRVDEAMVERACSAIQEASGMTPWDSPAWDSLDGNGLVRRDEYRGYLRAALQAAIGGKEN